ncbi:MAG: hypothetical protein WAW79_06570 [Steroidobacteraceae bacterium]
MLRIAIIGSCTVVALAALLMNRDDPADGPAAEEVAVAAARKAGAAATPDDRRSAAPAAVSSGFMGFPDFDTSGLLQESLSADQLVDLVNADLGEGFVPVDREGFKALLRSDPELRKNFTD